jgi:hypothetical protein
LIDMRSQLLSARAAALFASPLPTGSLPTSSDISAAIAASVQSCGGTRGCVATMAAAYGDYPETAAPRMRWALSLVMQAHGARGPEPDRQLTPA